MELKMTKSTYIYKDPLESGYKKFSLTRKQHNELFPYRQTSWVNKYEYYWDTNGIILHRYDSQLMVIVNTLFFPFVVIYGGLGNWGKIIEEYKKLFNQKKYGNFVSDLISKKSITYDRIMEIITKNNED